MNRQKLVSRLITISAFLIFVWYFIANIEDFKSLASVPLWTLIGIFIIKVISTHNNGLFIKSILDKYKKDIPAVESFYVALLSAMGNFFGPYLGGAGIRAIYLKRKYNLSYTNFASTLSGYYFITFFINSILGLVAIGFIYARSNQFSLVVFLTMLGWLVSTVLLAKVSGIGNLIHPLAKRSKVIKRYSKRLDQVLLGWGQVRSDRRLLMKLTVLMLIGFVTSYFVSLLQFVAVDVHTSFEVVLLYVVLSNFSMLVSITPGAIGIREAIFIFSGSVLSISVDQIVKLAVVSRVMTFISVLVMYYGFRLSPQYKKLRSFEEDLAKEKAKREGKS